MAGHVVRGTCHIDNHMLHIQSPFDFLPYISSHFQGRHHVRLAHRLLPLAWHQAAIIFVWRAGTRLRVRPISFRIKPGAQRRRARPADSPRFPRRCARLAGSSGVRLCNQLLQTCFSSGLNNPIALYTSHFQNQSHKPLTSLHRLSRRAPDAPCSYDLQYRMELANQGLFFDDEEVAAARRWGFPSNELCRFQTIFWFHASSQVQKHKVAGDKSSGLYVLPASFRQRSQLFRRVRFTALPGTRKCSKERGARRSRRWRAVGRGFCGAFRCFLPPFVLFMPTLSVCISPPWP
jgi:hypothetical protein